jgi:hypothetical protein
VLPMKRRGKVRGKGSGFHVLERNDSSREAFGLKALTGNLSEGVDGKKRFIEPVPVFPHDVFNCG